MNYPYTVNIIKIVLILSNTFFIVQWQLSIFSPHYSLPPYLPAPPTFNPRVPSCLCPCVLYTCSLMTRLLLSPVFPLPSPFWLLLICSLFSCLLFYLAHLFVLLIMFHLQVKSQTWAFWSFVRLSWVHAGLLSHLSAYDWYKPQGFYCSLVGVYIIFHALLLN